jgi:hypothetical protein
MRNIFDEAIKEGDGYVYREDGEEYHYNTNHQLHRENAPAIIRRINLNPSIHKEYWVSGERHRENGAAIEYADGLKDWFYRGKHIDCQSQEQFEKIIRIKAFWE